MVKGVSELREKWNTKFDFIFVTIGAAIGLGNLWRFPYLCYKNGGGAFLVPYFLSLLLVALPHVILHTSIGQYTSKSSIKAWEIVPVMKGLGYTSAVVAYGSHIVYGTVISWSLRYLYASFTNVLPWTTCKNEWNTPNCSVIQRDDLSNSTNLNITGNNEFKVSSADQFWHIHLLQLSDGIHDMGNLRPDLAICMLLTWLIAFLCVFKSINWTSKITYITASLPPIMLMAIFIRGLMLEGATDGVRYFLTPNISKLAEPQVWRDATLQNLYSLSLSTHVLIAMGSYNSYNHNFYRDSVILCAANSGTSLLSGFTIFGTLGFMAKQQNTSIETVAESGPGLAFVVYPQALAMMPFAQFWSALFFLTLFLLGMDSLFAFLETMIAVVQDLFPNTRKKWYMKAVIGALITASCCLFGLITVTQGGVYFIALVDYYFSSGWGVMACVVLETVAISWIYGVDKFYDHVCEMLRFKPRFPWFKYCWKYISPLICLGMFIYCLATEKPLTYNRDYVFPLWSIAIGWLLSLLSFIFIPGFALAYAWKMFTHRRKVNARKMSRNSDKLMGLTEINA